MEIYKNKNYKNDQINKLKLFVHNKENVLSNQYPNIIFIHYIIYNYSLSRLTHLYITIMEIKN